MCTEKIKIDVTSQQFLLIEHALFLYEDRVLNCLLRLSPEQFGSYDEEFYRSELESVKELVNFISNKGNCYGKFE